MKTIHSAFALVLFGLLMSTGSVHADTIMWEEEPQFTVKVDGKLDVSAKIYRPQDNSPFLLYQSDRFKALLLIDLGSKSVRKIEAGDIKKRDDYSRTSNGFPTGSPVGKYTMKSGASVFKYAGKKISIVVKPPLVGEVNKGIILSHSPVYAALRDSYKPKASIIKQLRKHKTATEVVIMFATWCPTCKQILPKFMKIMDEAANKKFSIRYIGIAMGGTQPAEELEKYGHDYPAFIFFKKGKEIGRIIGDPPVALEKSIIDLLKRGK
jgi:thiol-disulfide isomerase/thioredoxin